MLDSVLTRHFKFNDHKYDSRKETMYITKRRNSHNNSFDLQSSRDQSYGYFNQQLNYCAVDYYDVPIPKYTQKRFSSPVKKRKQSPKRSNSYHFHSQPKQNCQILKFEGYISRESPFRNWIGTMNKSQASKISQIQRIHVIYINVIQNCVRIIEKDQKSESYQLQEYLNAVNHRIQWNSLPKVFNYQKCQTPDILRGARERIKKF
ncbi:unnamed protein product (macronuclear) [Paramecium tetraurelia]|uniref:AP2/ERF domain-containing protein n=1 Tax=Paramecium tetraurelia TaxID=5888 RepID=A0DPR4_PARTE|nr:uncharacterized protein GSPATT00019213001 [Paramecium tetraurelia]CAK85031.1 unnamed protein product [Paramecium tetraurelia]|eukprot:XP_001452428.1 hypothetical protein (macronuclear) [Paramecium tetraurelia strain d4-2]